MAGRRWEYLQTGARFYGGRRLCFFALAGVKVECTALPFKPNKGCFDCVQQDFFCRKPLPIKVLSV